MKLRNTDGATRLVVDGETYEADESGVFDLPRGVGAQVRNFAGWEIPDDLGPNDVGEGGELGSDQGAAQGSPPAGPAPDQELSGAPQGEPLSSAGAPDGEPAVDVENGAQGPAQGAEPALTPEGASEITGDGSGEALAPYDPANPGPHEAGPEGGQDSGQAPAEGD